MFPIRNGLKRDGLSPLLYSFALVYAIRMVQVDQGGLKLNGANQLLVYADVNILGGSVHPIKENTQASLVTSKEIGLAVSSDEIKYVVMSRDQKARRSHNIKIDNSSFERVEQFKYFRTNLTNQNPIQEESKSKSKSGNSCYRWVQNLLSSS